MPEIQLPKVLSRAIINETLPINPTPEQELGHKMRAEREKGKWREAIELTKNIKPIEQSTIDKKAGEIGVERDQTGAKHRSGPEQARYDEFTSRAKLAKDFLDKGYDNLSTAPVDEKKIIADSIRAIINSHILLSSEFQALASDAERQQAIARFLKDPSYISKLRERVAGILDPEKKLLDEQELVNKDGDWKAKQLKTKEEQNSKSKLEDKIRETDNKLKDFERPATGSKGKKAEDLDNLRSNLPKFQAELTPLKSTLEDQKERLEHLRRYRDGVSRGDVRGEMDRILGQIQDTTEIIRKTQAEIEQREAKVREFRELETSEERLIEDKKTAESGKKDKDLDIKNAELEESKAKRALEDLKRVRENQEQDIVDKMKNSFGDAFNDYLEKELTTLEQMANAEIDRKKKEASTNVEQAMFGALRERWLGPPKTIEEGPLWKRKKVTKRDINETQVDEDLKELGEDVENLMKEMLETRKNLDTGVNYTRTNTDEIFSDKSDNSFFDRMRLELAQQLLAKKFQIGSPSQEDINLIQSSPWGKKLAERELANNPAFRRTVEQEMGKSETSNPDFFKKFIEQAKKKPWLLVLLTGLPGLLLLGKLEKDSKK